MTERIRRYGLKNLATGWPHALVDSGTQGHTHGTYNR